MNVKQKISVFMIAVLFGLGVGFFVSPVVTAQSSCGGVDTAIIDCEEEGGENADPSESGAWGLLLLVLNIMTAGVGILAVGGIVYGAILYASASDSAEQVQRAKEVIRNVVVGLIMYALMFVGLNYLIPGGIFN